LQAFELSNDNGNPYDDVDDDEKKSRDEKVALACLVFQHWLASYACDHFFLVWTGANFFLIFMLFTYNGSASVLLAHDAYLTSIECLVGAFVETAEAFWFLLMLEHSRVLPNLTHFDLAHASPLEFVPL